MIKLTPNVLVFLYREVLDKEIGWMDNLERAKQPQRLPVLLRETEVRHIPPLPVPYQ